MTATAVTAEEFVQRLLSIADADRRRALVERHGLDAAGLNAAVLQLVEEANSILGADPLRMERICVDALALAEGSGDAFLVAMATMRYGDAHRFQGHNAEACRLFDEAQALFQRLGRPVEAARTRIGWVECAAKLGRIDEALKAGRAAQRIFAAHGETLRAATLALSIGLLHNECGQYGAFFRASTTALHGFESLGPAGQLGAARSHQNRGAALGQLGRHREALSELEDARRVFAETGEAAGAARAEGNIGLNAFALGRYSTALRAFASAWAAARALGVSNREANLARQAADCYLALNRPADALRLLHEAESDLTARDSLEGALGIESRRVVAYLRLGNRDRALALLNEVSDRFPGAAPQHRAWIDLQRAAVLQREGAAMNAIEAARRARALARRSGNRRLGADALIVEAAALADQGLLIEARAAADRVRRIAHSLDASPLLHRAHELLGRVAEADGRQPAAAKQYGWAIAQLEREQRGVIFEFRDSFASDRGLAYARLAALQVRTGHPAEALATAERAKSRALADALRGVIEVRPRGNAAARRLGRDLARARDDYAAACARANIAAGPRRVGGAAEPETSAGLAALEARIAALVQAVQLAGDGKDIGDVYSPDPAPQLPSLSSGEAMVEFFASGDDLMRFFVRDGKVEADILAGAVPQVERLVRAFRLNLDAAQGAEPWAREGLTVQVHGVLSKLYAVLLSALPRLDGLRTLLVVPHGMLHYLPFHALHDGDRFLIERFAISYAPSAALFAVCQRRRPGRGPAVVLGHSAGGSLPFALAEARAVSAVLNSTLHVEHEATRAALEAAGRRASVVHIAAHGQFRPDAPLFSRIELADGPLTIADVYNLDLRAGLVALSACETGRAALGGGDELAGLSRAFLHAGAAALLVSLWRVDDASTAALMTRFYTGLATGAGRAAALRTAQISAIHDGMAQNGRAHPLYWAAFQIVGADRRQP